MAKKPFIGLNGVGSALPVGKNNSYVATYEAGVLLNDPVYITATGTVDRADASSVATMPARGVVSSMDDPAPGQCVVTVQGPVSTFAGLTPGADYVMSTTPGLILPEGSGDAAFPTDPDEVLQPIGQALNATTLLVDCEEEIVLPPPPYVPFAGALKTIFDFNPASYADADSVVDTTMTLSATATKNGSPEIWTRNGFQCMRYRRNNGDSHEIASSGEALLLNGGPFTFYVIAESFNDGVNMGLVFFGKSSAPAHWFDVEQRDTGRIGANLVSPSQTLGATTGSTNITERNMHCWATSYDPINGVRTYLDGVLEQTRVPGIEDPDFDLWDRVIIGSRGTASFDMDGVIYRVIAVAEEYNPTTEAAVRAAYNVSSLAPTAASVSTGVIQVDPAVYANAASVYDVLGNISGNFSGVGAAGEYDLVTRNGFKALQFNGGCLYSQTFPAGPLRLLDLNAEAVTVYLVCEVNQLPGLTQSLLVLGEDAIGNYPRIELTITSSDYRAFGIRNDAGTLALINSVDGTTPAPRNEVVVLAFEMLSPARRTAWINGTELPDADTTSVDLDGATGLTRLVLGASNIVPGAPAYEHVYQVFVDRAPFSMVYAQGLYDDYVANMVAEPTVANVDTAVFSIKPASYADADNVIDLVGNAAGTFSKVGTVTKVTRDGHAALYFPSAGSNRLDSGLFSSPVPADGEKFTIYCVAEHEINPGGAETPLNMGESPAGAYTSGARLQLGRDGNEALYGSAADDTTSFGINNPTEGVPLVQARQRYVIAWEFSAGTLRSVWVNGKEYPDNVASAFAAANGFRYVSLGGYSLGANHRGWVYEAFGDQNYFSPGLSDWLVNNYEADQVRWGGVADVVNAGVGAYETAEVFPILPNTLELGERIELEYSTITQATSQGGPRIQVGGVTAGAPWLAGGLLEGVDRLELARISSTQLQVSHVYRVGNGGKDYASQTLGGLDFTDSIEAAFQLWQDAGAPGDTLSFRRRAQTIKLGKIVDVDAVGGSTSGTAETTISSVTIPQGTLSASQAVAKVRFAVDLTIASGNGNFEIDVNGTRMDFFAFSATQNLLFEVLVWRTAAGFRFHGQVYSSAGNCASYLSSEVLTSPDTNDLVISMVAQDDDAASDSTVGPYMGYVRQLDLLDVITTPVVADGTASQVLYNNVNSNLEDTEGRGFRVTTVAKWDPAPNAAASYNHVGGGASVISNVDQANAVDNVSTCHVRVDQTTHKQDVIRTRDATALGLIDETPNAVNWDTGVSFSSNLTNADAGDLELVLLFKEAL